MCKLLSIARCLCVYALSAQRPISHFSIIFMNGKSTFIFFPTTSASTHDLQNVTELHNKVHIFWLLRHGDFDMLLGELYLKQNAVIFQAGVDASSKIHASNVSEINHSCAHLAFYELEADKIAFTW